MLTNELTGKTAVVTGAGAGIGRSIAHRLAVLGAQVYTNDIDNGRAETVAGEIESEGGKAFALAGDMGCEKDVARLFGHIAKAEGKLDILVTQAGIVSMPEYFHLPEELDAKTWSEMRGEDETLAFGCYLRPDDFDFMLKNNLHSTFYCCNAAIPLMRQAGGGHIITMAALGGGISSHFSPPYGIAKGAVVGITRALARELIPDNIIVNCISQGFIDAGVWKQVEDEYPLLWERDWQVVGEGDTRIVRTKPSNRLPMQRLGQPNEVAALVAFLVSNEASYLVGQNFNLSGGVLIP